MFAGGPGAVAWYPRVGGVFGTRDDSGCRVFGRNHGGDTAGQRRAWLTPSGARVPYLLAIQRIPRLV